jgi:CRISPR-associated endonuclease/helicase Cas3
LTSPDILRAILGREPYLWQSDLYELLLKGDIPDALDIPTGLGKTAIIAIWLAARVSGAMLPRRLVYVVDRRVVVDQATTEAEGVALNLESALGGLALGEAETWKRNLGIKSKRLPISTLRGQFADNRLWLENPVQCAIVVGTVDMIGSRLLFGGYGVNPRMRPVHAALLATDCLVVIDEAHLVPPFRVLVRQAARLARPVPVPPLRLMALSATGRTGQEELTFSLTSAHRKDEPVRRRLDSLKSIALHQTDALAKSLADRAFELGQRGGRVLIFCNSRDKLARVVAEDLRKRSTKSLKDQPTTVLLVGARRVAERDELTGRRDPHSAEWIVRPNPTFERFLVPVDPASSGVPAFLVATSAGEVGIDLDADHMVCDLVAWERMVQRLGRVNRSGRTTPAMVEIFVAAPSDDAEDQDAKGLSVLRAPFESELWPPEANGRRQAGPGTLLDLKLQPAFEQLCLRATTPEPLCPELRLAHLEAWSMTSLEKHPGRPRVEPWIRGWVDAEPQCRIVWRHVLPMRGGKPDKNLLDEFFEAFPPHLVETLETETYRAFEVLKARRAKAAPPDVRKKIETLAVVVLDDKGKVEKVLALASLEELEDMGGRTWVIDARLGGLTPEGLLDPSWSDPPRTLDNIEGGSGEEEIWNEALLDSVGRRLRIVKSDVPPVGGWTREASWFIDSDDDEEAGEEWRIEKKLSVETERDAARSRRNQPLHEHLIWAEKEARSMALALELSAEHRELLSVAASIHDLGKDRDLWQTAMGAPREERPLAKIANNKANGRALNGYRHEFGSLGDGEAAFELLPKELRDLARHIVAAHHGMARPVIAPVDPNQTPSLTTVRAREAALRFARLQAQWGAWGLAWWETLLRAADWRASASLDEMSASGASEGK